jgi:hypothetical protein
MQTRPKEIFFGLVYSSRFILFVGTVCSLSGHLFPLILSMTLLAPSKDHLLL